MMSDTVDRGKSIFKAVAPMLVVPDVMRAAESYRDSFGFTIAGSFGNPPVWAMVERDRARIMFGKGDVMCPNATLRPEGLDVYIWVLDLDALHEELIAKGANILEGPVKRVYDLREITVEDLNGYRLIFGE